MKITDLEIDGFGVWNNLKLTGLSRRVTAFYGPNEAGKTTVMQFMRSVLYGMSSERRKKYLPPLDGGRPGGTLGIVEGDLRFRAARIADRGPDDVGRVICTTPDGATGGDRLLRESLGDVDEPTFTNVFAVGLDEIHELGSLSGSKAAEWIYRLTSGLDRVSLFDVIQELRANRHALLNDEGQTSRIVSLTTNRDRLRAEVDRLREQNRLWSQLAVKIKELDDQIVAVESQVRKAEHHARTIEIAVGLKPNWRKREKLDEQLMHLSGRVTLPADAIERLNAINADIEKHQRQSDVLQGQRHQLRDEAERLGINELLVRNAQRIDALGEQRDWLQSLQRQQDELEREAKSYETRFAAEQKRLAEALGVKDASRLTELNESDFEALQPQIDALRLAQKRLEQAQRDVDLLTESERSFRTQIETAIVGGESHGLPMDLQEASNLVARLRKRLAVEQRLDLARQHEVELEQQSHDLLDDQVMPLWLFGWLLATFVIGALMLGVWALVPQSPFGKYGGLVALVGIGGAAFAWVFKYFADDAAAEKLDACQRQMEVVAKQIADAEREKAQVDAELPMTDGSVVLRMQAAERHLAELENVLPVEAQRKQAGGEVANAETRLKQAQREREAVLATWKSKIAALGLPADLDPQLLLSVTDRYGQLADLEARARHRREDAAARQREHETLLRRIRDLAEEVGCVLKPTPAKAVSRDATAERVANQTAPQTIDRNQATELLANPLDQLDHLLTERRRQLGDVQRREELATKAKELKAEEGKHLQTIVSLKRRRAAMFQAGGCEDEQEYRMMAADQHQHALLSQQRDAVSREIIAAIGRHEPEEVFNNLLAPDSIGTLDQLWEQATADLDAAGNRLKELAEQRGSHTREQSELAKDRSLAERQLDLSVVEKQLEEAKADWRRHATVNRVLERIRADYEAHRQPETLAEASRYMAKFTGGQYKRIWTPLSNDILLVDNAAGESLPVDVLSRGTREQLFLSVRMALVANFARRGVNVPMVLDDVLVNFDIERTRRAAEVLSEFAAGGHQLFFFTCHEHMWEMFRKLDGDCRRIPVRRGQPEPVVAPVIVAEPEPVVLEEPIIAPPKPKKKPAKKPRPVVVVPAPIPVPALDLYDYPFIERIIEERPAPKPAPIAVAPAAVEVEPPSEFHEYSFDLPAADYAEEQRPEGEHALAYIVSAEDVRGHKARGSRRHHAIPNYLRGDHLEPRRA
ncbi:MAG: AAA family ATPase [Planctomycetaceae bacterium]|nr:AAA family ATPase [Planctomycetaceae bacterium]